MRKRNITKTADTIFWYSLYLAPLLCYLIYLFSFLRNPNLTVDENTNVLNLLKFSTFVARLDVSVYLSTNFIYTTIGSIFGNGGILPLFSNGSFVHFMATYVICVTLVHFIVDVILFIPRYAINILDNSSKE